MRKYYSPLFQKRYDNPEVRLRDLDQLELLAQRANSRTSFLADLTLDPPTSTGDFAGPPHLDEEYVVLSTIHSAKGCEWDVIYIIHAADGVLPSDMVKEEEELEEERRLLYVAMTRARDVLYVTFPLKYYHRTYPAGDSYSTAQLTRFLPPSLFRLFERVSSASPKPADMPLPNVAGETAQHVREIEETVRLSDAGPHRYIACPFLLHSSPEPLSARSLIQYATSPDGHATAGTAADNLRVSFIYYFICNIFNSGSRGSVSDFRRGKTRQGIAGGMQDRSAILHRWLR